jgi:hypothetical protein
MVQPENIDSGHSNFQLDTRPGGYYRNLDYLLVYLGRSSSRFAVTSAQPLRERVRQSRIEKPYHRQCRLLRARRKRPRCRAAEQRDECASPHGPPSSGLGPHITTRCVRTPLCMTAKIAH